DKGGQCQRQHDKKEDPYNAGPVQPCRFDKLIRNTGEKILKYQRADGQTVDDVDQDKSPNSSVQLDLFKKLDQRNQDTLVRDEHSKDQDRKQGVRAPKLPFGKNVAVDSSQDGREDGRRDR